MERTREIKERGVERKIERGYKNKRTIGKK